MREIHLKLSSGSALLLLAGRKAEKGKPKIVSLSEYNTKIVMIEHAARAGCPFAKIAISYTDENIEKISGLLVKVTKQMKDAPSRIVVNIDNRKLHTIDISGYFHRGIRMADLVAKFDDLAEACHVARIKGSISKKECYQKINFHKKQIRALMSHAMLYTDHNFRHSRDQSSIEWKKMASLFGSPPTLFKETLSLRK